MHSNVVAEAGTGLGELATVVDQRNGGGVGMVLRWRYRLSKDGSVVDELILPAKLKKKMDGKQVN